MQGNDGTGFGFDTRQMLQACCVLLCVLCVMCDMALEAHVAISVFGAVMKGRGCEI